MISRSRVRCGHASYFGASREVLDFPRDGSAAGKTDDDECGFFEEPFFDESLLEPFLPEFDPLWLSDGCAEPVAWLGVFDDFGLDDWCSCGGDFDRDGSGESRDVDGAGVGDAEEDELGDADGLGEVDGAGVGCGDDDGLGEIAGDGPGVGDGAGLFTGSGFEMGTTGDEGPSCDAI